MKLDINMIIATIIGGIIVAVGTPYLMGWVNQLKGGNA